MGPQHDGRGKDGGRAKGQVTAKLARPPQTSSTPGFGQLQRAAGNHAVGKLAATWGKRPPVPLQRHSIAAAPAPPVVDEDDLDEAPLQRLADGPWGAWGKAPVVQGDWLSSARKFFGRGKAPAPTDATKEAAKAVDPLAPLSVEDKRRVGDIVKWGLPVDQAVAKLADPVWSQAVVDYWKFVAGGPYTHLDYKTANSFGKFDAAYDPVAKRLNITMRIKFTFPDDVAKKGEDKAEPTKRQTRHDTYTNNFLGHVTGKWSGKFSFQNVRPPGDVWGKLNPVAVNVKVEKVDTNQHFLAKIYKSKQDTANVTSGQVLNMFKGDDVINTAFVKGTIAGEQARLTKISPPVSFESHKKDIKADAAASLAFLGKYLSRLNMPKVAVTVSSRSTDKKLGAERAQAVQDHIVSGGLAAPHTVKATSTVGSGRRATVRSTVDTTFRNVQDTQSHEFGHMLGLDDEYEVRGNKGKGIETYGSVKAALGEDYANQRAKAGTDSASVMDGGSDVRVEHYIVMWEVLGQVTAAKAADPLLKFGTADWKFVQ